MLPYTVKYRPKTLGDVVGHSTIVDRLIQWINAWREGIKQKPLLLYGKAGMGKTSIVQALAHDFDLEILEMNASDKRTSKIVDKIAGSASVSQTFSGKMRVILFDEVDGLYLQDRGGGASINKILKTSEYPIILTANDAWSKKLTTIRSACELVEVRKVHCATISKLLDRISISEDIQTNKETLKAIAKNAEGDVRSAVNDFEFLAAANGTVNLEDVKILSQRDRAEQSMFKVVQKVLKTMNFSHAVEAIRNISQRPDFTLAWICENVPKEYKKAEDVYRAYNMISRADIFLGRVYRRQNYGFWRYASVLKSAGVALSKDSTYSGFTRFGFPSTISYLSRSKANRGSQKSVAKKIGEFCHVSIKVAISDYVPMMCEVLKNENNAIGFAYKMNFDESDLEFFGVPYPKKVLKEVEELKKENIKKQVSLNPNQKSLSKFF